MRIHALAMAGWLLFVGATDLAAQPTPTTEETPARASADEASAASFDHPSGRTRICMAMDWKAEHLEEGPEP